MVLVEGMRAPERPPRRKPVRAPRRMTRSGVSLSRAARKPRRGAGPPRRGWEEGMLGANLEE